MERYNDKVARIDLMLDDKYGKWDLSENDLDAIRTIQYLARTSIDYFYNCECKQEGYSECYRCESVGLILQD